MKKIDYTVETVLDRIYHVVIPDQYDMCMTFCRVQEFYESPFKQIRGKHFTLLELMEVYSKNKGEGCFTYPIDWGGFNVPSSEIEKCYFKNGKIDFLSVKDFNIYDSVITEIHKDISKNDEKYYLIGTNGKDLLSLKHEIVHGMFYLNENYKKEVVSIIREIPEKSYNDMKTCLLSIGYTNKVMDDEINAYLSSGDGYLWETIKITKKLEGIAKKLQSLFVTYEKNYKNGI